MFVFVIITEVKCRRKLFMQVYSINSFRGLPLYFSGKHEASDKVSKKEQKNYEIPFVDTNSV